MDKIKKKRLILFLCTGDICRSPMAVFFMKKRLEEKNILFLEVRGSGVMTVSSLLPAQETVIVMKEDGIDVTPHRSTKLTKELVKKADLILGMTPFHVQMAKRISEQAKYKTHLFMEYVEESPKQYQIADPMGGTLETFKTTYKTIKKAIDKLIDMEVRKSKGRKPVKAGAVKTKAARKAGRPRKEKKAKAKSATAKKAEPSSKKKKTAASTKVAKKKTTGKSKSMAEKKSKAAKSKPAAKKSKAKKPAVKKSESKKSPPSKKAAAKKSSSKKTAPKKSAAKKTTAKKKSAAKKPAAKKSKSKKTSK